MYVQNNVRGGGYIYKNIFKLLLRANYSILNNFQIPKHSWLSLELISLGIFLSIFLDISLGIPLGIPLGTPPNFPAILLNIPLNIIKYMYKPCITDFKMGNFINYSIWASD